MVKLNLSGRTLLFPKAEIQTGNVKLERRCLLDSGATFCHMSYPLWNQMGLNQILLDELSKTTEFFQYIRSIKTAEDLNFENLPLPVLYSELGDSRSSQTYPFMIDRLVIKGSPDMAFSNVSVRLINSTKFFFIIGMNIIKYLSVRYRPTVKDQNFEIALEKEGHDLYVADQQNHVNNFSKVHFNLIQDYIDEAEKSKAIS